MSAVLRSWEERFGAVLTDFAPGLFSLEVGTAPLTEQQALQLAAEHWAFGSGDGSGEAGWLRELANVLIGGTSKNEDLTAVSAGTWLVKLNN